MLRAYMHVNHQLNRDSGTSHPIQSIISLHFESPYFSHLEHNNRRIAASRVAAQNIDFHNSAGSTYSSNLSSHISDITAQTQTSRFGLSYETVHKIPTYEREKREVRMYGVTPANTPYLPSHHLQARHIPGVDVVALLRPQQKVKRAEDECFSTPKPNNHFAIDPRDK